MYPMMEKNNCQFYFLKYLENDVKFHYNLEISCGGRFGSAKKSFFHITCFLPFYPFYNL